nr:23S rRNA (guanosine(2251)-2'-O)-methyltransferase RlmB [Helicobacter macacae]
MIYGKQILLSIITHHSDKIEQIYLSKDIDKATFAYLKSANKPIIKIDNKKAQALARGGNHQGFLASISPLTPLSLKEIKQYDKIIVLCGLNDMGNIGGIFRSAYCLGVDAIILADSFSDFATKLTAKSAQKFATITRSSVGAAFDMPFCIVPSALEIISELKEAGFMLLGTAPQGENIKDFRESKNYQKNKWALFLGSEENGLCAKITKKFDKILSVKMHRDFNSLNVSVAAGIVMSYLLN